ncbi:hypothetical protein EJG51_002455 [Undibacterium piscinae]|uniref:Uncharacterized protein n=1 Tax=Undibacterium piscinae TaxID=2495591 RepID=A0A6M4A0T4_9BURK|nr:hypothetical protein EJG51_002455 [Undibacterium piscinae]
MIELTSLLSKEVSYKSIEFLSPVISQESLAWLLFSQGAKKWKGSVNQLSATNLTVVWPGTNLGAFDMRAVRDPGTAWQSVTLVSPEKGLSVEFQPKGETVQIKLSAKSFAMPFGSSLNLADVSAEGTVSQSALTFNKLYGVIHNGILSGNAILAWMPAGALRESCI